MDRIIRDTSELGRLWKKVLGDLKSGAACTQHIGTQLLLLPETKPHTPAMPPKKKIPAAVMVPRASGKTGVWGVAASLPKGDRDE